MCANFANPFCLLIENRTVGFGIAKLAVYYNVFAGQYRSMILHGRGLILCASSQ